RSAKARGDRRVCEVGAKLAGAPGSGPTDTGTRVSFERGFADMVPVLADSYSACRCKVAHFSIRHRPVQFFYGKTESNPLTAPGPLLRIGSPPSSANTTNSLKSPLESPPPRPVYDHVFMRASRRFLLSTQENFHY